MYIYMRNIYPYERVCVRVRARARARVCVRVRACARVRVRVRVCMYECMYDICIRKIRITLCMCRGRTQTCVYGYLGYKNLYMECV